jgi:UDP-N-acetylmuramoyl-L-alanyl-D-glutamate--2,6-diaminopimelate ligase
MKTITKKFKKIWWGIKSHAARYYYGNPSKKLKIVGVTGTNGKTTTATLLYKIATELGYKAGLVSTVENIVVKEVRPATHTTPDSITLTKLFRDMVKAGCEYAFMEVSSHALDQNRVNGVNFVGGIFTNLTHDHLDYHKNFENYFEAKKKFFKMLPRRAFALTNTDDPYGAKMLAGIEANQFSYGFNDDPHFKGEVSKISFSGLELKFNDIPIHSKLLGKFNAYNLLAVWSASSLLGFDMKKVNKILETIEPPRGRFQNFLTPSGVLIVVDYAHSPDALEKILLAVEEVLPASGGKIKDGYPPQAGKIISVFGCGGDRDPLKRPIMGKIGARLSDIAIFTSDNPRSEDPDKIISEMLVNLHSDEIKKVVTITDRRKAIKQAVKLAQKGDIILCAGKGHETYQEVKGIKTHFDDMEEFKKL